MTTLTAMPKYEAYKDSGVEWIGYVPEHWHVIRLKNAAFINPVSDISSCDLDDSVSFLPMEKVGTDGAVEYDQYRTLRSVKQGFTSFQNNDVIIAKITPCFENGKGAHLKNMPTKFGYGSTEFHVLRAYKNYNPAFLYYLTKSHLFMDLGEQLMTGSAGQKRVPTSFISDFLFASPSEDEQTAIANFLDEKTAQIDEAIAIKEKQIELLKERKQIIIQQAVTQGLDPTVPMKDSGVEWIGMIPAHWDLLSIKFIADIRDGTHDTPNYVENSQNSRYLITSKDFIDDEIDFSSAKSISLKDHKEIIKRSFVEEHDLLMSMIGGNIGKCLIVKKYCDISIKNVALFKVGGDLIKAKFIRYYLVSGLLDKQISLKSRGGAQAFLSLTDIRNLIFFNIPESEMENIVKQLDIVVDKINSLENQLAVQIEKLKEYKTTLINNAVTGKIKVV